VVNYKTAVCNKGNKGDKREEQKPAGTRLQRYVAEVVEVVATRPTGRVTPGSTHALLNGRAIGDIPPVVVEGGTWVEAKQILHSTSAKLHSLVTKGCQGVNRDRLKLEVG
jgi:hypothetical protein